MPSEWGDRIMHARLQVGDAVLMGSDSPPDRAESPKGFCVMLQIDDPAEGERIFRALGDGGTVQMPYEETFWAHRFGMVVDRFGIPWMINCEKTA
jgi:PhnB protein